MKLYKARKLVAGKRVFENESVLTFDFAVIRDHVGKDIQAIVGFNLITRANWRFDLRAGLWSAE